MVDGFGGQQPGAPEPPKEYRGSSTPYTQHSSSGSASSHSSYGTKGASTAKTFFTAFLGALLACILVFAGFTAFGALGSSKASGTSGSSVTLGSQSPSTINVSGEDSSLAETVASKALPSVVCIYVYTSQSSSYGYFGVSNDTSLSQSSLGSGIVLTEDGYVLTNYHVIEGSEALKVNAGGQEYDAEVVGTDASSDLAVIKLKDASGLTPADIGDSDDLNVGQWVMTIGSPFGLEQSVATGVVSATSRSEIIDNSSSSNGSSQGSSSITIYPNMIQTDAAINPGNSGGALVDKNGKVIGVNTLITSYSGNYSGVGFAIPVNYAIAIAQQIIAGETPSHAQLGVSLSTVNSANAQRYGLAVSEGAYVSAVSTGSGADEAGIEVGDIIVSFNGKKISSASDLMVAVRECSIDDTVDVKVNRDGAEKTFSVNLGSDASSSKAASTTQNSNGGSNSQSNRGQGSLWGFLNQ